MRIGLLTENMLSRVCTEIRVTFVGRGLAPAAFFDSRRSLRRDASIFRFAQCQVCFANIAPALRCSHIITQIGRENNISAEILLLRTVEDACPYKCCVKHPYEKEPKSRPFSRLLYGHHSGKCNDVRRGRCGMFAPPKQKPHGVVPCPLHVRAFSCGRRGTATAVDEE